MIRTLAWAFGAGLVPLAFVWAAGDGPKSPGEPDEKAPPQLVEAYVYHCHDGDTCRVRIANGIWLNVRLAAIDAPEVEKRHGGKSEWKGQPMGEAARDALNALIKGQDVRLRQVDLDQYNRPVVEILLKDQTVNRTLVEQGFAEVYRGKTKRMDKEAYFAAEARAKRDKKGIWGMSGYQSPSEYRKENKR